MQQLYTTIGQLECFVFRFVIQHKKVKMKDVKALINDLVGQLDVDNGDDNDDLVETKPGLLTAFL